jgi:hypothetical protein
MSHSASDRRSKQIGGEKLARMFVAVRKGDGGTAMEDLVTTQDVNARKFRFCS